MSGAAGVSGGVDTNTSGWKILMMTNFPRMATGTGSGEWMDIGSSASARRDKFGTSTGSGDYTNDNSWKDITMASTGAEDRVDAGDGHGLYKAFFECEDIQHIAYVAFPNGTAAPTDLTSKLDEYASGNNFTSSGESWFSTYSMKVKTYTLRHNGNASNVDGTVFENLLAINNKLRNAAPADYYQAHSKDNIFGTQSTQDLTAYHSGSNGGSTNSYDYQYDSLNNSDNFVFWGINRDSDNDTQALCFFGGSLHSGKGDAWRGQHTHTSLWSYWGDDFHDDSQKRRIGYGMQTTPGISGGTSNSNTDYSGSIGEFYLIGKK